MASELWEVLQVLRTDAGMFGIWEPRSFSDVTNLDAWNEQLSEDAAISSHIAAGVFVPINIGADGAFQFTVRGVDGVQSSLSDRENRFLLVSSEPYLLIAQGPVVFGPLEAVGSYTGSQAFQLPLEPGRYSVIVHLIEWDAEPNSSMPDGNPGPNALPDFIIEIRFDDGGAKFRTRIETFDQP